ncbi:MAG: hypothetical protein M3256_27965 [Actinomycetota bacterium]|nr:hypothetical protein [Actinomycetota bacterium]
MVQRVLRMAVCVAGLVAFGTFIPPAAVGRPPDLGGGLTVLIIALLVGLLRGPAERRRGRDSSAPSQEAANLSRLVSSATVGTIVFAGALLNRTVAFSLLLAMTTFLGMVGVAALCPPSMARSAGA